MQPQLTQYPPLRTGSGCDTGSWAVANTVSHRLQSDRAAVVVTKYLTVIQDPGYKGSPVLGLWWTPKELLCQLVSWGKLDQWRVKHMACTSASQQVGL